MAHGSWSESELAAKYDLSLFKKPGAGGANSKKNKRSKQDSSAMSAADLKTHVLHCIRECTCIVLDDYYTVGKLNRYLGDPAARSQLIEFLNHLSVLSRRHCGSSSHGASTTDDDEAGGFSSVVACKYSNSMARELLQYARQQINGMIQYVDMRSIDPARLVQIVKWIYNNEDRVWASRGGRPQGESLAQFLSFAGYHTTETHDDGGSRVRRLENSSSASDQQQDRDRDQDQGEEDEEEDRLGPHYGHQPNPGFLVVHSQRYVGHSDAPTSAITALNSSASFDGSGVVLAYTLGDYSSADSYEVVTAWVSDECRGLALAVQLYWEVMRTLHETGCRYLICDVISGGLERVIASSALFRALYATNLHSLVIAEYRPSYSYPNETGVVEQFQRIKIDVRRLMHLNLFVYRPGCLMLFPFRLGFRAVRWVVFGFLHLLNLR